MRVAGDILDSLLNSQITWGVFGLIFAAAAFSGKLSMNASRWCLLFAGLVAGVGIWKSTPITGLAIVLRTLLTIFLTSGIAIVLYWLDSFFIAKPIVGPVNAGVLAPIPDVILSFNNNVDRIIQIGISGVAFKLDGPRGEAFNRLLGQSRIALEQLDKQLLVTTDIRDHTGKLLATLARNEWATAQPGGRIWDRNYTHDSLEIVDRTLNAIFQVRILSDRVQLQGKWYHSDGKLTVLMDPPYYPGHSMIVYATDADSPDFKIGRIFKYPSAENLGILEPPSPIIVRSLSDVKREGKFYNTQYEVTVTIPVESIDLTLKARTITSVKVSDRRTGARVNVITKSGEGLRSVRIANARGAYVVSSISKKPDRVFIYHNP